MARSAARPTARWRLALAVLALGQAGAGLAVVAARGSAVPRRPPVQRADSTKSAQARQEALLRQAGRTIAVQALLDERARAVLAHDRAEFLSTVDPAEPAFYAAQAAEFGQLAGVPFASFQYRLDPQQEQPAEPGLQRYEAPTWVPQVDLLYQLAGFDRRPTVDPRTFTFVDRPDGWRIGSNSDFPNAPATPELWDFGPVLAVHGRDSLVLGFRGQSAELTQIAGEVDRDIPAVSQVWGTDWQQQVVVLVPATAEQFARLIGATGSVSAIAAVATAELPYTGGLRADPVGNRVIVNPPDFALLSSVGRRVVLTHEITHVASRVFTGPATPTWLAEGFADYVGYLHSGLSVPVAAQELAASIARSGPPAALPPDSAFNAQNPQLAATYEQAWLACRLIAERAGQPALVGLYREVGRAPQGSDAASVVSAALQATLHQSLASFTAGWRASLAAQLGAPS